MEQREDSEGPAMAPFDSCYHLPHDLVPLDLPNDNTLHEPFGLPDDPFHEFLGLPDDPFHRFVDEKQLYLLRANFGGVPYECIADREEESESHHLFLDLSDEPLHESLDLPDDPFHEVLDLLDDPFHRFVDENLLHLLRANLGEVPDEYIVNQEEEGEPHVSLDLPSDPFHEFLHLPDDPSHEFLLDLPDDPFHGFVDEEPWYLLPASLDECIIDQEWESEEVGVLDAVEQAAPMRFFSSAWAPVEFLEEYLAGISDGRENGYKPWQPRNDLTCAEHVAPSTFSIFTQNPEEFLGVEVHPSSGAYTRDGRQNAHDSWWTLPSPSYCNLPSRVSISACSSTQSLKETSLGGDLLTVINGNLEEEPALITSIHPNLCHSDQSEPCDWLQLLSTPNNSLTTVECMTSTAAADEAPTSSNTIMVGIPDQEVHGSAEITSIDEDDECEENDGHIDRILMHWR